MKLPRGLILAAAAGMAAGSCAAGGGGGGAGAPGAPAPIPGAETLAQGERPRENQFTRQAERDLDQVPDAATPEEGATLLRDAVSAAQQAIDADPRNPLPYFLQGRAYIGLEDYQAADAALTQAETLRPVYELETESIRERAWIALYEKGAPLVNAGQYAEAATIFENANAIYRGRPEVMVILGQVDTELGNYERAIENFRNAQAIIASEKFAEMDSTTQANWSQSRELLPTYIAQALMQSGDYADAADAIQELLAEDPDNLLFLRNLGTLYVQMKDTAAARAVFQRTLAVPGIRPQDYYAIGVGYYTLEDYDGAVDAFKAAATASPMDRDALEMWARSLQLGHPPGEEGAETPPQVLEELVSVADRWVALDPNNRNAYLIQAQTSSRLGDQDRASELVAAIEALPVLVDNVQLQRFGSGGGVVSGSVHNVSAETGSTVTLTFTFYDEAGSPIGTRDVSVQAPAPDAAEAFQVEFESDQPVAGYGYTVSM